MRIRNLSLIAGVGLLSLTAWAQQPKSLHLKISSPTILPNDPQKAAKESDQKCFISSFYTQLAEATKSQVVRDELDQIRTLGGHIVVVEIGPRAAPYTTTIEPANAGAPDSFVLHWNPTLTDSHERYNDGVCIDYGAVFAHELRHIVQRLSSASDPTSSAATNFIPVKDIDASAFENAYRKEKNLCPRMLYDLTLLPQSSPPCDHPGLLQCPEQPTGNCDPKQNPGSCWIDNDGKYCCIEHIANDACHALLGTVFDNAGISGCSGTPC